MISKSASADSGFRFVLEPPRGSAEIQAKLQAFLDEATSLLPRAVKSRLDRPISVSFQPLDEGMQIQAPCGDRKDLQHIYGQTRTTHSWFAGETEEIQLHEAFIPVISGGREKAETFSCGHRDLYRLALATLLHETAHVFDFTMKQGLISGRKTYRQLTGWKSGFLSQVPRNQLRLGSPDPYEYTSISEQFAVNFEYFLLDPDYACRRPVQYTFLSSVLGHEPFPNRRCRANDTVFLFGTELPVSIDPDRVYQAHYLFASQGKEIVSRWGHSSLRLVVCAPERKEVGPDCLKDTTYHVVVSFRANVNDLMINGLKGFFGGYPSQLYMYSLPEIAEEYNRLESRDLLSLPLNLTRAQVTLLVDRIREVYWGYAGKYYFLSNNCATELGELLKGILRGDPRFQSFQNISVITPLGLYDDLVKTGVADSRVLEDRKKARKLGYLFAANRENLEEAFSILKSKGLRKFEDLDQYLSRSSISERRALYWQLQLPGRFRDKKLTAAFYLLESQIRRLMEKQIESATFGLLMDDSTDSAGSLSESIMSEARLKPEVEAIVREFQGSENQLNSWGLIRDGSGYGIPLKEEILSSEEIEARQARFNLLIEKIKALAADGLAPLKAEIAGIKDNLQYFSNQMKRDRQLSGNFQP